MEQQQLYLLLELRIGLFQKKPNSKKGGLVFCFGIYYPANPIKKIRRNTTYLPVIAYSANPDNKTPSLQAGADKFLLKPLPAKALKEKLEECAVKQIVLYLDNESLSMHKVDPANNQELNKLKTLDKKGLAQITVIDTSQRFLIHKTAQNKLIHDLGKGNNNIIYP